MSGPTILQINLSFNSRLFMGPRCLSYCCAVGLQYKFPHLSIIARKWFKMFKHDKAYLPSKRLLCDPDRRVTECCRGNIPFCLYFLNPTNNIYLPMYDSLSNVVWLMKEERKTMQNQWIVPYTRGKPVMGFFGIALLCL